jgi:hypothetical protein
MRAGFRFRFLFVALLATALLTSANVALTPQARAGELAVEKVFTESDTFYTATDQNGTLTAKVAWASAQNTLAWSFQPSPTVAAIATGPMNCQAGHMQLPGYHDNHSDIPVDYIWHSSVPGSFFNVDYTLWGSCTFPVQANGLSGQAVLSFRFNYFLKSVETV